MNEKTTKVYYVTATSPKQGGERPRTELAKFFARAHAEAHKKTVHRDWVDVRVEERVENASDQHEAHRSLVK